MNRALVTGSNGFVGRHIVQRLFDLGVHVTMVDNLSSGKPCSEWIDVPEPSMLFLQMDARDYFRSNFFACDFDVIFHCAAVVGGRLTIDGEPLRVATDLSIDAELFHWITRQKLRPKKVVYFSSSAVYPITLQRQAHYLALSENLVDFNATRLGMPDQTYGMSKFVGEYLAHVAAKKYDLDVVCYRPFSGYGEDQSFDYPFPAILKRVFDGENPITVWGSGNQLRDFMHIDDVVDAVFETMDKLKPGEVLNLGSGVGTTFTELAKLAGRCAGRHVEVKNDASKPEGVFARVADIYKFQQFYQPKITLEQGIRRMLDKLREEL